MYRASWVAVRKAPPSTWSKVHPSPLLSSGLNGDCIHRQALIRHALVPPHKISNNILKTPSPLRPQFDLVQYDFLATELFVRHAVLVPTSPWPQFDLIRYHFSAEDPPISHALVFPNPPTASVQPRSV